MWSVTSNTSLTGTPTRLPAATDSLAEADAPGPLAQLTDEERYLAAQAQVVVNDPQAQPRESELPVTALQPEPSVALPDGDPEHVKAESSCNKQEQLRAFRIFTVCVLAFAMWPASIVTQVALGVCGLWLLALARRS